jgi:malonate-semialdehyde dehydrogenase (acetylating)/methylmalonate-semialdehyde dehydrogenase
MTIHNYVEGQWLRSGAATMLPVLNPATAEELGRTPLSGGAEVEAAAQAASRAFPAWRRVPVVDRVQYLFKLKALLD